MAQNWVAVYTRSCYEERVSRELKSLSIEQYHPTFPDEKTWANRQKVVISRPLFTGYTFARFDMADFDMRVAVLRIVGTVQLLPGVEDSEIVAVRRMLAAGARPGEDVFVRGDRVRIKWGALEGLEGTFVKEKRHVGHFVLSIEALGGRTIVAEVDPRSVQLLHPRPRFSQVLAPVLVS